jgi:DNA-binding PadR family transcriptional regulator
MHPCHNEHDRSRHHHHAGPGGPFGFGPRGPFGPGFGGPGPRVRRGDVRAAVLALLVEQDMHGYQIIQELASRSGGAWTPSPGSVYPTLQMLEDQGLVSSTQADGKRVFTLTDEGRAADAERGGKAPWEDFAGDGGPRAKLREAMFGVGAATMQVGQAGSKEQIEQVVEILDDARKRIYLLLAGGE